MKHDTNLQESINNSIADKQLAQQLVAPSEPEVQEETTEQEVVSVEVAAPKKEDHPNFKALRSKAEQAERERDDYARRLQQYEQQQAQQQDPEYKINPDDIVEGKHLSKYDKKIKQLEDQIKNYQQQSSELGAEARLKATYPDFDKVVNATTIEALRDAHPDIAETLNAGTNLYSKAATAYKLIKQFGLYQEDMFVGEKAKAQANAAKPRPLAGVSPQQGESPLSRANAFSEGLTDNLKSELHKEMIAAMKNR